MKFVTLSDRDEKILKNILKKYQNESVTFFAFGSRVTGKAKKYSDLDIAYEYLTKKALTELKTELEDSELSITVDFVNLHEVDLDFQGLIRSQMIPL